MNKIQILNMLSMLLKIQCFHLRFKKKKIMFIIKKCIFLICITHICMGSEKVLENRPIWWLCFEQNHCSW